jgi:hypothetical protein
MNYSSMKVKEAMLQITQNEIYLPAKHLVIRVPRH